MTERIRLAKPEEAEWLHGLLQRAYTPLVAQGINFTVSRSTVADVAAVIASESTFVLERDGQRVATLTVRFPWTQDNTQLAPWPFLHWFAVELITKGRVTAAGLFAMSKRAFCATL